MCTCTLVPFFGVFCNVLTFFFFLAVAVTETPSDVATSGIPDAEKDTEAFLNFVLKDDENLKAVLKTMEK